MNRVDWDLGEDSPHIAIIGGSGSGKSELAAWIVAQNMRGGAGTIVLDPKATSHRWLMNRKGVLYCGQRTMLFDTVMWLDDVMNDRIAKNIKASTDIDFPRLQIVIEERNSLQDKLRDEWTDRRQPGQPQMSPAIKALDRLSSMGRSINMVVLLLAQETAQTAIGRRSNFGAFAIAGRTAENHWKNVGVKKPAMRATPGSFGYVVNGTVTPFQAVYPDVKNHGDRLWEWATQGDQILDVHEMMNQREAVAFPTWEPGSSGSEVTPIPGVVTLREWSASKGIPLTTVRNWPKRHPDFPVAVDEQSTPYRYSERELDAFLAARRGGEVLAEV